LPDDAVINTEMVSIQAAINPLRGIFVCAKYQGCLSENVKRAPNRSHLLKDMQA
jgi:ribosomal protein S18